MPIRPLTPDALVDELATAVAALPGRVRVLVDGAEAARPQDLADALVDPLRVRSRPVVRVSAWDYLRPASVRLERGREDADAFYDDWLDEGALVREVLRSAADAGLVLPALWDAVADRAHRLDRVALDTAGVVVVDGPLLLGRGLPAELAVHLALSPGALARRTPPERAWTLPAYARYTDEVDPATVADLVVRADHPDRPALQW
jgi:hypothetical protein